MIKGLTTDEFKILDQILSEIGILVNNVPNEPKNESDEWSNDDWDYFLSLISFLWHFRRLKYISQSRESKYICKYLDECVEILMSESGVTSSSIYKVFSKIISSKLEKDILGKEELEEVFNNTSNHINKYKINLPIRGDFHASIVALKQLLLKNKIDLKSISYNKIHNHLKKVNSVLQPYSIKNLRYVFWKVLMIKQMPLLIIGVYALLTLSLSKLNQSTGEIVFNVTNTQSYTYKDLIDSLKKEGYNKLIDKVDDNLDTSKTIYRHSCSISYLSDLLKYIEELRIVFNDYRIYRKEDKSWAQYGLILDDGILNGSLWKVDSAKSNFIDLTISNFRKSQLINFFIYTNSKKVLNPIYKNLPDHIIAVENFSIELRLKHFLWKFRYYLIFFLSVTLIIYLYHYANHI